MADAARTEGKMTLEEFFEWQHWQDEPYELRDGVPVTTWKAMTGATKRHDTVNGSIFANLYARLRGNPCQPYTDDQSVVTDQGTRRPDIVVDCSQRDDDSMEAAQPRMVVEVFSPSNVNADFVHKMDEYRRIPALQVILVVETRIKQVAVWRRTETEWTMDLLQGENVVIDLPEIGTELPFEEIYERLTFPAL